MLEVDKHKRGKLTYPEFRDMMIKQMKPYDEFTKIRNMFQIFDPNKTGKIVLDEFIGVLSGMGESFLPEEIRELMSVVEKTEDGLIDFDSLLKLVCL